MKIFLRFLLVTLLMALGMAFISCTVRDHRLTDYGKHSREFFARQHVFSEGAVETPSGLDSEEAAAIHGSYRQSLAGGKGRQSARDDSAKVLLLREGKKK